MATRSRNRSQRYAVAEQPSADTGRINVPKLNRDPISSLRPFPILVKVGPVEVEIPAMNAAEWLTVLMVEKVEIDDVFPGLLSPEDTDLVEDIIIDGALDMTSFRDIILGVIETASARNWWVALRLIEVVRSSWDVIGAQMVSRGVDAVTLSLSAWLDIALLTVLKEMDPKDVTMFTMRLEAPPLEETTEVAEELEMTRGSFMAMAMD